MSSQPLILSDARLLAEFMHESEFKAFFEKRFAVPPDYAALLFKNGQLIDSYKGAHFSVGGLVNQLKSIVGGSTHVAMLLADLKPFSIQTRLDAKSRDNVDIAGIVTLELQLNPDKPSNVLGLMTGVTRNTEQEMEFSRKGLSKNDTLERIRPHLSDRVFEATLSRMDATEIRGNAGVQDKIQADIMLETERVLGNLGLLVNSVSVEWAQNAAEAAEQARADALRQQDEIDFQIDIARRNSERVNDATVFEIQSNLDLEKLQNASEDELKLMALNSEITFIDARETAKRRQEMEELDYQINFLEVERKAKFENAIATARNDVDITEIKERHQAIDLKMKSAREAQAREAIKLDSIQDIEIGDLQTDSQLKKLKGLQDLDAERKRLNSDIKRQEEQNAVQNQIDLLVAQGKLSPEQLMILNPNLSAEAAQVLIAKEQAKAAPQSSDPALVQRVLDMTEKQSEQLMKMHETSMKGAVGVAAGAGGKSTPDTESIGSDTSLIDCPKCSTTVKSTVRYCPKCGHKLRT